LSLTVFYLNYFKIGYTEWAENIFGTSVQKNKTILLIFVGWRGAGLGSHLRDLMSHILYNLSRENDDIFNENGPS
jgi:hypothetical protein